jgi:hypothetical protein
MSQCCKKCGATISALNIALSWPSQIKCKACSTCHHYRFAAAIGTVYLLFFLSVMFPIKFTAEYFPNVQDGIYTVSSLGAFIQLSAPFVALAIVGPIYVWLLGRFLELKQSSH